MNYYKLTSAPEDCGYIPQDNGTMDPLYRRNDPDALNNASYRRPVGNVLIPSIKFRHQAKFTDMLSLIEAIFPCLVVSDKFLEIITRFRIQDPEVFRLPIHKKDKLVDYNVLIANTRFPQYIDFDTAEVFHTTHSTKEKTVLHISHPDEYQKIEDKIDYSKEYLSILHFKLKSSAIKHDLFCLPPGCAVAKYIVSEALAEAAKGARLTGVAFEPIEAV